MALSRQSSTAHTISSFRRPCGLGVDGSQAGKTFLAVDQRAHSVADGVGHVAADGGDALLTGPFRLMRGVPAAG